MARITNIRPASDDDPRRIGRRTLLKGAAGATVAGLAGASLASGAAGQTPEAASGDETFFPSGVEGVPDAYLAPPEPFKSYDGVPGNGGTVRTFTISYNPPPPPRDDNPYWQELDERLGVTWEPIITPQPDYGARSATLIASGDLPDIFYLNPGQSAPQQWQAMAQGAFQDLTPYLTGDALQQFPNLAALPEFMWNNSKFQGKILGVPTPSTRSGNVPFYRGDWVENLGLAAPANMDEMVALLAAMTNDDPDGNGQQNTWGQGRYQGGWEAFDNQLIHRMFKTPNGWRLNDDGTLVAAQETDEYRQALETITQLYADGYFHPDASGMTFSDAQNAYIAGETGFHCEGFGSFFGRGSVTFRIQEINPDGYTTGYIPQAADGSGLGVVNNNIGFFGMNAIPSSIQDEERVLELLRILDYLASPFGSEEQIFLDNGIEGVHHEVQENGARVQTDEGRTQIADLTYQMGPQNYFYYPENPELALEVQDLAKQAAEIGQDNPTWGLYSPTDVQEGPVLNQFATDTTLAIITGQESMDRLDSAIEEWRSRGGDQIRQEFEEALQQEG